jgi:hypothetical protein
MIVHLAGQDMEISCPVLELIPYQAHSGYGAGKSPHLIPRQPSSERLTRLKTRGWVADSGRVVEILEQDDGYIVKVEGSANLFISRSGDEIALGIEDKEPGWLERQVISGPGLVFALALRGIWCLHASAAMFREKLFLFLGESGRGKSTLAGALSSQDGWKLVADDILPVTRNEIGLMAWPHFPQLKLPVDAQPAIELEDHYHVDNLFLLKTAFSSNTPSVEPITGAEEVKILLAHTAGTRMFTPELLGRHLEFCAAAAGKVHVSRLVYPRTMQALPAVRQLLEEQC